VKNTVLNDIECLECGYRTEAEHFISKCAKCGANTFAYSEFVKCDCGQKVYLGRYDNNLCYGCGKIYNRLGQEITLGASKKLLKQALEKEMQRLSSYVPQGKEKGEGE